MRYLHSRALNPDETLFISDSYNDISRKIYERENVSLKFLDYLLRNIIRPFVKKFQIKDYEACWAKLAVHKHLEGEFASRELKRLVLKCY